MTGEEIREARERAGMTQADLAERVGVSLRTIGNWERGENVPRGRMGRIEEVLRPYVLGGEPAPLTSASDTELLGELAKRLGAARRILSGSRSTLIGDQVEESLAAMRSGPPGPSQSDSSMDAVERLIREKERELAPGIDEYDLDKLVAKQLSLARHPPLHLLMGLLYPTPSEDSGDTDDDDSAPSTRAGGSPAAEDYKLAAMDRDDSEEIEAQQIDP